MYFVSSIVCGKNKLMIESEGCNFVTKVIAATIISDAVISISSFVIGLLGILAIIKGMPPAASYALFSATGLISILWVVLTLITNKRSPQMAFHILKAIFGMHSVIPGNIYEITPSGIEKKKQRR